MKKQIDSKCYTQLVMFERFTERARQVTVLAQDEARFFGHNYVGTEHLLLGLLQESEGIAAIVLEGLGITVEEARQQVTRICGQNDEEHTGQIPFTPRAKKALELALREALSLGHNYIGTEHILLGIVRENEGVAARILLDFDTNAEKVRTKIILMLSTSTKDLKNRSNAQNLEDMLDQQRDLIERAQRKKAPARPYVRETQKAGKTLSAEGLATLKAVLPHLNISRADYYLLVDMLDEKGNQQTG